MPTLSRLRAATLPFVTRSLRGHRLRRYTFLSLVLGAMTVLLGAWFTLSSGDFEREMREGFSLETPRHYVETEQFTLFADDDDEFAGMNYARARLIEHKQLVTDWPFYRLRESIGEARATVTAAVNQPAPRGRQALAQRAQAALYEHNTTQPLELREIEWGSDFNWYNQEDVARLEVILDNNLVPQVKRYESPFGLLDVFRFAGVLAGLGLAALAFVFGPLLAGSQMAQETHENTLMPLTGTSMRARDLIIGLFSGPMAVIAIIAAPQILVLGVAALVTGSAIPIFGMLAVLAATCFFLSMLTQLIGLGLGRQRTPGLIGIALLMMLTMLTFFGAGFGFSVRESSASVLAILPQGSAFHLLRAGLIPPDPLWTFDAASTADFSIIAGTVGVALLGLLAARALERRITGVPGPSLSRVQALLGAAISVVLVTLANPAVQRGHSNDFEEAFYISLGVLTIPLLSMLMTRVPVGDIPAKLRNVRVWSLVGELFSYVGLLFAMTIVATGGAWSLEGMLHPIALAYLTYTLILAALITIRATSLPAGIAGRVWVAFCAMFTCMTFVHAAQWAHRGNHMDLDEVFVMFEVSPLLGLIQIGLTVALPILLMRSIRPAPSAEPKTEG